MRSISVRPSATKPASTRLAEARKSVAITGAAVSLPRPCDGRIAFRVDLRTHAAHFEHVHEAIFKNRLDDGATPLATV